MNKKNKTNNRGRFKNKTAKKRIAAKKSLGQNFLKSKKALDSIIDAGEVNSSDLILEIGPGRGALTDELISKGVKILAIEKDDILYEFLQQKYRKEISQNQILILNRDILELNQEIIIENFMKLSSRKQKSSQTIRKSFNYKLIANIPYYITGQIIRNFLSLDYQPQLAVLLVQKEVAERIISAPQKIGSDKNPKYKENLLSISVKAYSEPIYIQTVKAGSFSPAPKVDSAIIRLQNISKDHFDRIDEKIFFNILKAGFKHKRKNLVKNLKSTQKNLPEIKSVIKNITEHQKYLNNPKIRAEDLLIDDWFEILKDNETI